MRCYSRIIEGDALLKAKMFFFLGVVSNFLRQMLHAVFRYEGRPAAFEGEKAIKVKKVEACLLLHLRKKGQKNKENFFLHQLKITLRYRFSFPAVLAEGQRPSDDAT